MAYNGTLSYFNCAPHLNEAKIASTGFCHAKVKRWILTAITRTAALRFTAEDISKEKVGARARSVNGAKFRGLNLTWIEEIDVNRDIFKKSSLSASNGE